MPVSYTHLDVYKRQSFRIREIERVCKTKLEEKHLPSGEEVRQHKEASVLQKIREVMELSLIHI